ncbi:MAG: M23 family metallopeptidase [Deltaproteobacteria bacterium]
MLALVLPALMIAASAPPKVRFSPAEPRLGDLVIVYVETTDRTIQSGSLEAFGCVTPLDRVSKNLLRGFVGIPTHVEAGGYRLEMMLEDQPLAVRLPVDHRIFEESQLRVSKRFTNRQSSKLKARLRREAQQMSDLWKRDPSVPKAIGGVFRPVAGVTTSPFGVRRVFNGRRKSVHYGLDLKGITGDPIHAALAGRVVLASMLWKSGGTTILDHGGGLFSAYFHMSRRDRKVGDFVEKGDLLGAVGATGRVTGPHLHLAVMTRCLISKGKDAGKTRSYFVDPERFLGLSFDGDPAYMEVGPTADLGEVANDP